MKVKRIIAGLLAMVMLLTATLPTSNVKAASGTASLDSLGKLGTVNVGSKSESGIWLQTLVNEKPVFVWIWDWHVIQDIPIFQRQRQLAVTVQIRKMLWKLKLDIGMP